MATTILDSGITDSFRDYGRLDSTIYNRNRLSSLKIMVVGAGALGNEVVKNLALLGLGTIYVVDRDLIESSNLTRSILFCVPEVHQIIANRTWKAEFAALRVSQINPEVRCIPLVKEIADVGLGLLARMDLVFSCLDNELARLELSWGCQRVNVPFVDAGLGRTNYSSGLVSLFPGSGGPCYACRKGRQRRRELLQELHGVEDPCWLKERQLEEQGSIATTPLMASVIGAMQVEMGLRHILAPDRSSSAEGKSVRVALAPNPVLECFSFALSPECPLHEARLGEVIRLKKYRSTETSVAELICATKGDAESDEGSLCLDWPLVAEAECRHCHRVWQPMMRKAHFQRTGRCPSCESASINERQVLNSIDLSSKWAAMTLTQAGLPAQHIHEVYWSESTGSRKYIEVTGDWDDV